MPEVHAVGAVRSVSLAAGAAVAARSAIRALSRFLAVQTHLSSSICSAKSKAGVSTRQPHSRSTESSKSVSERRRRKERERQLLPAGYELDGGFTITQHIGRGAFGNVYRANWRRAGRDVDEVAIKLEEASDKSRLSCEADVYRAMVGVPSFPRMHWYGQEVCRFGEERVSMEVLAMDLLGPSLRQVHTAIGGAMESRAVAVIGLQLLSCLEALHERRFVYNDLKPANVLLPRPDLELGANGSLIAGQLHPLEADLHRVRDCPAVWQPGSALPRARPTLAAKTLPNNHFDSETGYSDRSRGALESALVEVPLSLVDFGFARHFDLSEEGHAQVAHRRGLLGTARYASVPNHLGLPLGPRDDLEALAYMMLFLRSGSLPWDGVHAETKRARFATIARLKQGIRVEQLCAALPTSFTEFVRRTLRLHATEKPDYYGMRCLLHEMLR